MKHFLLILGILISVSGCSNFSFLSGKNSQNVPAALQTFESKLIVQTAWSVMVGSAQSFVFSPVFSENSVLAAAVDGTVVRVDALSGRVIWKKRVGTNLTAGVASDGPTIAVAGDKGNVYVLDHDGNIRWKNQVSSEVLSAPAVGNGLVVVRSADNKIVAFDAGSGVRRWSVQRAVPALTLRTAPGIVVANKTVFVALPGGKLLALSTANGTVRWEATVGDPRGATELERVADVSGAPIILGKTVCAVAYQGRTTCFDLASGVLRWVKNVSSEFGLALDEKNVFVSDQQGALTALTRDNGVNVWRNTHFSNRHLSTPIVFDRGVAVGDGFGYIHFFSREEGALIARVTTDGSPIVGVPILAGKQLVFQTQAGTLISLSVKE